MFYTLLDKHFLNELYKNRKIFDIHMSQLEKAFTKSIKTFWNGSKMCGPSIVICYNILLNNNISNNILKNIKIYNNCIGCYEYHKNHSFMIYKDNLYIIPTYKQFLINPLKYKEDVFIGTRDELEKMIKEDSYLNDINLWRKSNDITEYINNFISENNLI